MPSLRSPRTAHRPVRAGRPAAAAARRPVGARPRARLARLALLALLALPAGPAGAGELYLSGGLAISGGFADGNGRFEIPPAAPLPIGGSDVDSSPVLSGAIGFEFPMHQILPRRWRSPRWMPDVDLEDWNVRFELEVAGGRQYDYLIAASGAQPFRTTVTALTSTVNAWLELPVGNALAGWLGRARMLEPLAFAPGIGIGYERVRIKANNITARGIHDINDFVWQVGAEFNYPLSNTVVLSSGYRYVAIGELDNELSDVPPNDRGAMRLDVGAHEFRTSLRFRFHSVRFPRGLFDSRRPRYQP